MMNTSPPPTERRPIYQSQMPYPAMPYNQRRPQFNEFEMMLRNAPNSTSEKLVLKWNNVNERYEYANFDPEKYYNKISRNDILETLGALYQEKKFQSGEDRSNCLDLKTLVAIAAILILAFIFMFLGTLGQGFYYASFGLIILGIVLLGAKILYNRIQKSNYHQKREKKYREIARRLNQGKFIDKPFSVSVGKMAAWIEFLVSYVENDRPNRRMNQAQSYYFQTATPQNQNEQIVNQSPESPFMRQPTQQQLQDTQMQPQNPFTPSPMQIQGNDEYKYNNPVKKFTPSPGMNIQIAKPGDVNIYPRTASGPVGKRTFSTFGEASFGKTGQVQRRYRVNGINQGQRQVLSKIKKPALKPELGSIESDTFETTTRNNRAEKLTYGARNYSSQSKKYLSGRRVIYSPNKENVTPNIQITPKKLNYTPKKTGNYSSGRRRLTPQKSLTPTRRLPPIVRYISNSPQR